MTSDSSHILNAVVCICDHQGRTFEGHLIIINAKGAHFCVCVYKDCIFKFLDI